MKNKTIVLTVAVLGIVLLVSCGTRTDRGVIDGENTRSTTNRANTDTTPNRMNTNASASKQNMDDNATLNRRNENTQTVEMMAKRDDIHNANQDDKVQQTAAANSRKMLYTQLNMTQEQIQKLESMMHNQNNSMTESGHTQSPRERQLRTDMYFKEILDDEQFTRYERWKGDNPNTRF